MQFSSKSSSRLPESTYRTPYRSIISLRTFYAYGARSRQAPPQQRSLSCNFYDTSKYKLSTTPKTSSEMGVIVRRSPSSSSALISVNRNQYFSPIHGVINSHSSILDRIHPLLKAATVHTSYSTKKTEVNKSTCALRSQIQESGGDMASSINSGQSESLDRESASEDKQCVKELSNFAGTSQKVSVLTSKEDDRKMVELEEKNNDLKMKIEHLKSELKNKERSEMQLKRKLLERTAEVKVWRNKYEMQKSSVPEMSELILNEHDDNQCEVSNIMEQLNMAAEKLTRLNAVKDLKLLQHEMETALKEISK